MVFGVGNSDVRIGGIADTEDDGCQQDDGHRDHNAHAGLDACALCHKTHNDGGDDAACGADQGDGADGQVIAPDAVDALGHGTGVDGGHEQTDAHDADENGQLAAAEEHQQEEAEGAHAVHQQNALSGHTANQSRDDHPSDEDDDPEDAGHELADPLAEDAGVLEIGHQPVDDGILGGDVEEEDRRTQPEVPAFQEAAVTALMLLVTFSAGSRILP